MNKYQPNINNAIANICHATNLMKILGCYIFYADKPCHLSWDKLQRTTELTRPTQVS